MSSSLLACSTQLQVRALVEAALASSPLNQAAYAAPGMSTAHETLRNPWHAKRARMFSEALQWMHEAAESPAVKWDMSPANTGAHLFSGGSMARALCTQSSQNGATSLSLIPAPA